jgi:hypothetical protein
MKRLLRVLCVFVVILAVITMTNTAKAYTNSDLKSYLNSAHIVNNMTFELTSEQKDAINKYLDKNQVTDTVATSIMADLKKVESEVAATGATDVSQISDSVKSSITSTIKTAGNKAGLDVNVDTKNKTVMVTSQKDGSTILSKSYKNGNIVKVTKSSTGTASTASTGTQSSSTTTATTGSTLLYTGANYTIFAISALAIVAVAILVKRRA